MAIIKETYDLMEDTAPFTKIESTNASEICQKFKLRDQLSAELLKTYTLSEEFFGKLVENKLYIDAVKFLAHALPKHETILWACTCLQKNELLVSKNEKILEDAKNWLENPSENFRQVIKKSNNLSDFANPFTWIGLAIFWSDGSLTDPEEPVVGPGPTLTAQASGGAIMLATVLMEPELDNIKYETYLKLGINIARGGGV